MIGTRDTHARLACLYAGAVWGIYWIPLRHMADAGIHQIWITPLYFLVPSLIVLPLLVRRWAGIWRGGMTLQLTVISSGVALTLYSTSIVYTDVVRAIMLFYMMPIWSILLARFILGEVITPVRVVSMALALFGMLVLFGLGEVMPIPKNAGDWMGLVAGLFWSITTVRLRRYEDQPAIDLTIGFFVWGLVLSTMLAFLLAPSGLPTIEQSRPVLPMLLLFVFFAIIPGTYASLWGPKYLNPGVSGLLFMTEIAVGALSVALLAGEPFGVRELAGVLLIATASLIEPLMMMRRRS